MDFFSFGCWVSCGLLWLSCSVSLFLNLIVYHCVVWHYKYCVFVSFSRSQGQTVGRRWVWRVIPLHLSINLETISSVPYRMSKPRWAEDESIIFFLRLSPGFLSKHINTSYAVILYCPPSLSVNEGGPWQSINAVRGLYSMQYAKENLHWKLLSLTGSFHYTWHHSV